MQQISPDNALTSNLCFYHVDSDKEIFACGFQNGAMAIYPANDLGDATPCAIKYFFPAETARQSATLEPYTLLKTERQEHRRKSAMLSPDKAQALAAQASSDLTTMAATETSQTTGEMKIVTAICHLEGSSYSRGALAFATAHG